MAANIFSIKHKEKERKELHRKKARFCKIPYLNQEHGPTFHVGLTFRQSTIFVFCQIIYLAEQRANT